MVFGPDGAGKSAAIQWLTGRDSRLILAAAFNVSTSVPCSPGDVGEESPPVVDPHGKPPRGFLFHLEASLLALQITGTGMPAVIRPAFA